MRRQAKAATAGSTPEGSHRAHFLGLATFLVLGLVASLGSTAPPALAACPNEAIREQQRSTYLPSCRAYELVSPPDQAGNEPTWGVGSLDGNHAWIGAIPPLIPSQSTGNSVAVMAQRTPSGWRQRSLAAEGDSRNLSYEYRGEAADGSRTVVKAGETRFFWFLGDASFESVGSDGSRHLMATVHRESPFDPMPEMVGASDDAKRIFFQDTASLLPEDTHAQGQELYEASEEGQLTLVGIGAGGAVPACGAVLANAGVPPTWTGTGQEQNGLSADGRSIFFSSPDPTSGCGAPVDLYLRRHGHTVDVSAPRNGKPDLGATYAGNSSDGNTVYFVTKSQLVPKDENEAADIYAYHVESEEFEPVTIGAAIRFGNYGYDVTVSPDGSHVFFIAENPIGGEGVLGNQNLFVWSGGHIKLIASAEPSFGYQTLGTGIGAGPSVGSGASGLGVSNYDGSSFLFVSPARITGYNNRNFSNEECGGRTGGLCEEIYKYSTDSSSLVCVSCDPSGAPPVGDSVFTRNPAPLDVLHRFQSEDGSRVFFTSPDQLVPQDVNKKYDAYEWHNGKISLISSGRSENESSIVSVSGDGSNVFFLSTERLAPEVGYDNAKLYDARINGGFLRETPPAPCEGEACRTSGSPRPASPAIASAGLSGPGNSNVRHRAGHRKKKASKHRGQKAARHVNANPLQGRGH